MNLVAVCISKEYVEWKVREIPFYCHTEGWRYIPHYPRVKTRDRIDYLSARRNDANRKAIQRFPDLTHIMSIDSYYVNDTSEIKALIEEYDRHGQDVILGASTWYLDPSRIIKRHYFWDTWTNPEFIHKSPSYNPPECNAWPRGWAKTTGAGGFAIYPRWAWEKQGYGVPDPFPDSGCEANYLSRCPGIETFITFNVKAWREPPEELKNKPYVNRVRTTVGLRTHLGLKDKHLPDMKWIMAKRVLRLDRRYAWIRGTIENDGFKWKTRGIHDTFLSYMGHEDYLRDEMLHSKGDLFVDVGAHVGTWSIRLSKNFREVMAFEPTVKTANVLKENLRINQIHNVHLVRAALGEMDGWADVWYFPKIRGEGGNSLSRIHPIRTRWGSRFANKTDLYRLDDYSVSPDLLKIDTEGFEIPVLKGAKLTLPRTRKAIVEVHREEDLVPIRKLLEESGMKTRVHVARLETHVIGEK